LSQDNLELVRARATARRLGLGLDQQWVSLWTVLDGRLIRHSVYADRREALEQAGLRE
jgi:ketosteroid isomerase-like protein